MFRVVQPSSLASARTSAQKKPCPHQLSLPCSEPPPHPWRSPSWTCHTHGLTPVGPPVFGPSLSVVGSGSVPRVACGASPLLTAEGRARAWSRGVIFVPSPLMDTGLIPVWPYEPCCRARACTSFCVDLRSHLFWVATWERNRWVTW